MAVGNDRQVFVSLTRCYFQGRDYIGGQDSDCGRAYHRVIGQVLFLGKGGIYIYTVYTLTHTNINVDWTY